MLTIGSLCSGIGGLELGLEWAGLGPVLWQCEIDPYCRAVLRKHWPASERHEDVTKLDGATLSLASTSCASGRRARTSAEPGRELALTVLEAVSSSTVCGSFLESVRNGSWWRMLQAGPAVGSAGSCPSWNSLVMRAYRSRLRQLIAERRTCADESSLLPTPMANDRSGWNQGGGSGRLGRQRRPSLKRMASKGLWPTPTVSGNYNRKGASQNSGDGLATAVAKRWPTPRASDARRAAMEQGHSSDRHRVTPGGPLNPTWVEWLMGFPLGWTVSLRSATRSSLNKRRSSDGSSENSEDSE